MALKNTVSGGAMHKHDRSSRARPPLPPLEATRDEHQRKEESAPASRQIAGERSPAEAIRAATEISMKRGPHFGPRAAIHALSAP